MRLVEPQLGRVLDGDDPLLVGNGSREGVEKRRLARAGASGNEHVQLGLDAALEELDGLLAERAHLDHVVERQPAAAELADRDQRTAERERRDDGVDAAAVGQASVDHRRRLVDAAADLGDHLVDDPAQVPFVVEHDVALVEAPATLDPDVVRAVDHDLGHGLVGEEPLEWAVAEDVVGDLERDPLPVVARDARLLGELVADVREHSLAKPLGVHVDVVELRSQVADDREVDPALQLCEGITLGRRTARPRGIQALVQLHYRRLLASSDFLSPVLAAAGTAGPLTGAFA